MRGVEINFQFFGKPVASRESGNWRPFRAYDLGISLLSRRRFYASDKSKLPEVTAHGQLPTPKIKIILGKERYFPTRPCPFELNHSPSYFTHRTLSQIQAWFVLVLRSRYICGWMLLNIILSQKGIAEQRRKEKVSVNSVPSETIW